MAMILQRSQGGFDVVRPTVFRAVLQISHRHIDAFVKIQGIHLDALILAALRNYHRLPRNIHGQHQPLVIVGVVPDQVYPARRPCNHPDARGRR
jgi:hypothetical protein